MSLKTSGIYKLHWPPSGHTYIGQSVNLKARIGTHLRKLRKGEHTNARMQEVYDCYGEPSVSIEAFVPEYELNSAEVYYVSRYNSYLGSRGLNNTKGGGTRTGGTLKPWSPTILDNEPKVRRMRNGEIYKPGILDFIFDPWGFAITVMVLYGLYQFIIRG